MALFPPSRGGKRNRRRRSAGPTLARARLDVEEAPPPPGQAGGGGQTAREEDDEAFFFWELEEEAEDEGANEGRREPEKKGSDGDGRYGPEHYRLRIIRRPAEQRARQEVLEEEEDARDAAVAEVRLWAWSWRGALLGLSSLAQLCRAARSLAAAESQRRRLLGLPCVELEDWPLGPACRGLMLDISRDRVPTVASLERLAELCAGLKFNVLMLYMEHTFAYPDHPEVWAEVATALLRLVVVTLQYYPLDFRATLVEVSFL